MKRKTNFSDAGFTLIELIVVIAILAILGGIGAVGYSGYVEAANRAADESMIADIEKALILGAYSGEYKPGETVGAVVLSKDSAAVAVDYDDDKNEDIQGIMTAAFGAGWEQSLQLRSDYFLETDYAAVYKAVTGQYSSYFDAVPKSSFYTGEGSTDALVADVDEIVSALYGVLGKNSYGFSKFWGEDFHQSVETGGLGETWNSEENAQMAANLTAFAAANQITKLMTSEEQGDQDKVSSWVGSWTGEPVAVTGGDAYVADLVVQYAQCVAYYNWALQQGGRYTTNIGTTYGALQDAMKAMAEPSDAGYLTDFNNAISAFWKSVGTGGRTAWQNDAAAKDAQAFLASMLAMNTLESKYVQADQAELLNSSNAFAAAGAADVLDAMVAYASMPSLPSGDCAILLIIGEDGSPAIA